MWLVIDLLAIVLLFYIIIFNYLLYKRQQRSIDELISMIEKDSRYKTYQNKK